MCTNGDTSATGQTQLGDIIGHQNECLPPPPKSCGQQASGSTWWQNMGTQNATCENCWNGTAISCTYNTQVQELCTDGVTSATGLTQQGSIISQNGQCPPQPRACGQVPNGGTTWQDHGQTPPFKCGTCIDGSDHLCIAVLQQQLMCNDGTLNPTGQTQTGPTLGYYNTCPNVVNGSETYKVPTASPKADVVFVVDTTPTDYLTIVNLSKRFMSLVSAWKNVDYQIGITNSVAFKQTFDINPSQGLLMELNPYPVPVTSPLRIITPSQYGGSWIFRRNMSFNGLQWPGDDFCNEQPYCQDSAPEPMGEIVRMISRKNAPENKGFFRNGATFVPIILSAHDERYVGAKDPKSTKPADVITAFNRSLGSMHSMKGYSIIIQPGDKKCLEQYSTIFKMGDGGAYGNSLDQFAKQSGGKSISICQTDYAKALSDLSTDVRQKISSITLQHVPYGNSLKISFSPSIPNLSWVVQGTSVLFNQPLPPGTQLSISYLYTP
jgi:hypothetical protein